MKHSKVAIITVLFALLFVQISPAFAIKETLPPGENKIEYINLDFWNSFEDANLNYFILRAMKSNIDLKAAALNSEVYKDYIKVQRAEQLPSLNVGLTPGYSKQQSSSKFDWNFRAPLYVSYEADIFLKNRDKTNLSKKDYEISLLDEKSSYISTASMVGTVYFNIAKLNKAIEMQEKILTLRDEIYKLNKIGNRAGEVSLQDVLIADKSLVQAEIELVELKKEKEQLENAFAVLLGEPCDNNELFNYSDIEKIEFKGNIPNSIKSSAITLRPDYQKAEKNVEKAGLDIRVAKKEFLPTIDLTGLLMFNAFDLGSIFTTKNALMMLSSMVTGEIFTGGRKMANLKIKKSQYEIALQNYEKTNLTALQEVNDALVIIKNDEIKYANAKRQTALEENDCLIYQKRFEKGIITKLDVLRAQENVLSAKKLALSDKADCFINYIGLYKALGANLQTDA